VTSNGTLRKSVCKRNAPLIALTKNCKNKGPVKTVEQRQKLLTPISSVLASNLHAEYLARVCSCDFTPATVVEAVKEREEKGRHTAFKNAFSNDETLQVYCACNTAQSSVKYFF
jgi:hypothetical protein